MKLTEYSSTERDVTKALMDTSTKMFCVSLLILFRSRNLSRWHTTSRLCKRFGKGFKTLIMLLWLLFTGRAVLRVVVLFMLLWLLSVIYNYVTIYKPENELNHLEHEETVIVEEEPLHGE